MLTALHFLTHIGLSWIVSSLDHRSAKDRWLITLAGVLPDFDGVGILWSEDAYLAAHRAVGHGLVFVLVWLAVTLARADERWSTAVLAALSFHLHLLLDLVGTGGVPIRYFWPFSERGWSYAERWTLGSWPNAILMILTLLGVLWVGWRTRPSCARGPGSGDAPRAPRTTTGR